MTCRSIVPSTLRLSGTLCATAALALGLSAAAPAGFGQMVRVPAIRTVAGNGTPGYIATDDGGPATSAKLFRPGGTAVDGAGNLYIADTSNNRIRLVTASTGVITTVAGNGTAGYVASQDGGQANAAELNHPYGMALDGLGNLYIADTDNNRIRKVILSSGIISTVAGNGTPGYDANNDGGPATAAELNNPFAVAFDLAGNFYIADTSNNRIREVAAATGYITTVAGTGQPGYVASQDTGPATSAELNLPHGIAVDGSGNLYIGDSSNNRIRMVSGGNITTIAGNGTAGYVPSQNGGLAIDAELNQPYGVAVDGSGILYIADSANSLIREVFPTTQVITNVAGSGTSGYVASQDGGAATVAEINFALGVSVDLYGNLYIADYDNSRIRRVDSATSLSTFLPNTNVLSASITVNVLLQPTEDLTLSSITAATSQGGIAEYTVGTITGCVLSPTDSVGPSNLCVVPITFHPGYPGQRNVALTVLTSKGTVNFGLSGIGQGSLAALSPGILTNIAGTGSIGNQGNGGPATGAQLSFPRGVAMDSAGDVYIADPGNNAIRKITPDGIITTVAGNGNSGYSASQDGGLATTATLTGPVDVAVDSAGNLYINDTGNNRIRKVTVATGMITTIAGGGTGGDGSPATAASLHYVYGMTVDASGNVYFCEIEAGVVRKVTAATGILTTIVPGLGGEPGAVAVDSAGNLYIAASEAGKIFKFTTATGVLTTVAGKGGLGYEQSQDGGPAVDALLWNPQGITLDSAGNLYISDTVNGLIREVFAATGIITTIAGNRSLAHPMSSAGDPATAVALDNPLGITLDSAGNLIFADPGLQVVSRIATNASQLNFYATPLNQVSSDSPRTVTLYNTGNVALDLLSPTDQNCFFDHTLADCFNPDTSGNDFVLDSGSSTTCPIEIAYESGNDGTLPSGASCTFGYFFDPQHAGSLTTTSVITDTSLNVSTTQTITLTGSTTVGTTAQTITFPQPAPGTYPGSTTLTATSDSGLPVTYTVTSGPATLSGSTLTYTGIGSVVVTASQPGNANYAAAAPVSVTITVSQPESFITWIPSTLSVYTPANLTGVLDANDSIPASISYTATLLPTGSAVPVSNSTSLPAGNYTLTALITPDDFAYAQISDSLPFKVQNMNVFVANSHGMVSLYNDGTLQSATSGGGIGAAVDSSGYVWSINPNSNSLSRFTDVGVLAGTYTGVGGLSHPTALAIDGASTLWVTNSQTGTVSAITSAGTPAVGTPIGAAAGLSSPTSVSVDTAGSLWIANAANNTVTEIIGVAAPVATPIAAAVTSNTLGTKP
jgi:sugar lactone lactonase YvrE